MKNQIHRYQSTGPVECEKEMDPTQEVGTDNDEHSTTITLAIVLTAFIISPMTECLGPVLELNVNALRLVLFAISFDSFRERPSIYIFVFCFTTFIRDYWRPFHWLIFYRDSPTFKWSRIHCIAAKSCRPLDWLCSVQSSHLQEPLFYCRVWLAIAKQTLLWIIVRIMAT